MKEYNEFHGNLHLSGLALADEEICKGVVITEAEFNTATALCAANDFVGVTALLTALGFDADYCVHSDREIILAGKEYRDAMGIDY